MKLYCTKNNNSPFKSLGRLSVLTLYDRIAKLPLNSLDVNLVDVSLW